MGGRERECEREGKEGVRKKEGEGKGKGGERVPLALILQFDHCWIQYTNVMYRRTDRHWATAKTALTHSVAQ